MTTTPTMMSPMPIRAGTSGVSLELYAKVTLHSLTALKMSSKCSFIPYKLRFFIHFRLVMKHNLTFAYGSL
uniref:Uncharacterized protein n=1 Tax=Candidatus Kentrum sp. DK TaxID=2126562 RepID=A0A450SJS9_9GAMM|nr:MAG: hypothetical protein BECKDK2373B_GA0170837_104327 [Candidatus Kentron sp. DK]